MAVNGNPTVTGGVASGADDRLVAQRREWIRQAGLYLMDLMLQEEGGAIAGGRSQQQADRTASPRGSERVYCEEIRPSFA